MTDRPARFCLLPRLKVHALPGGRIVSVKHHREVVRPPVDDGWWFDVLYDPRAKLPTGRDIPANSPNAIYRLDRQPRGHIEPVCHCGYRSPARLDRDKLIETLGPSTNVIWATRELIGCPAKNKVANGCHARVWRWWDG